MKVFNTLTRKKEEFIPMEPGRVKLYACGPTVYNFIHIGNARPLCVFDVLRRYLEYKTLPILTTRSSTRPTKRAPTIKPSASATSPSTKPTPPAWG